MRPDPNKRPISIPKVNKRQGSKSNHYGITVKFEVTTCATRRESAEPVIGEYLRRMWILAATTFLLIVQSPLLPYTRNIIRECLLSATLNAMIWRTMRHFLSHAFVIKLAPRTRLLFSSLNPNLQGSSPVWVLSCCGLSFDLAFWRASYNCSYEP